jgi:8-oxo-dGTP pyrophosphatase MutT (NUDIX family)
VADAEEWAVLRAAFDGPEPARGDVAGASAVLLPLLPRADGASLVFTRRTTTLSRHAGQVSFPGGGLQPEDAGPLAAALRETEEEVGLPAKDVRVLGHLTDYVTYYGRLVCAYVGEVEPHAPPPRIASPREVAEVLVIPIRRLRAGEGYEGRELPQGPRGDRVVHYWHLPEATIWGITGELLARFLEQAFDWQPPRPARAITDPGEFVP